MAQTDCIFCKIAVGDVPSEKLFDDGTAFVIRDLYPKAPVHLLIIPHRHIEAVASAPAEQLETAAHCVTVAAKVAAQELAGKAGFRLVVNQGADAGQEVPHFHMHLLAGRRLAALG